MGKTHSEMASYIKKLIPADIPKVYPLNPILKSISNEENIRNGVVAFRDFLYGIYDLFISDGSKYNNPPKNSEDGNSGHESAGTLAVGYPFIYNVTTILLNIGYYGTLTGNGDLMLFDNWKMLISGELAKKNISVLKIVECLRFLVSCGLCFNRIDLDAKKPDLNELSEITYPATPVVLTGLKTMAVAHRELSANTVLNYYVFQRCDYRVLLNETPDTTALIKDYIYPLSVKVQDFVLKLHYHYVGAGLVCKMKMHYFGVIFSYSYKSAVLFDYMPSPDGCSISTKAKNMDKYANVIEKFPIRLREKISRGYGCEKKLFNEPCQKGCHGFSFSLDDSILDISGDIEIWLDKELSCLQGK